MQSESPQLCSLDEMKTGEHALLHEICAGRMLISRLSALGFTPGVEIEMTQNYGRGPLVVNVRGTRIALGRQQAKCTIVKRKP